MDPRCTRVTAAVTPAGPAAVESLASAPVFPWRHPAHNAISPKRTRPATISLFLFDIACPCYDRRLRTVRKVHPCRCSEEEHFKNKMMNRDLPGAFCLGRHSQRSYARGGGRDQTLNAMSDCGTSTSRSNPRAT